MHVGAIVVEVAAVCVITTALGSTPEVGIVAETTVTTAAVDASGQRTETSGVVVGRSIAYCTSCCTAIPASS